jgi:hypothetical protein
MSAKNEFDDPPGEITPNGERAHVGFGVGAEPYDEGFGVGVEAYADALGVAAPAHDDGLAGAAAADALIAADADLSTGVGGRAGAPGFNAGEPEPLRDGGGARSTGGDGGVNSGGGARWMIRCGHAMSAPYACAARRVRESDGPLRPGVGGGPPSGDGPDPCGDAFSVLVSEPGVLAGVAAPVPGPGPVGRAPAPSPGERKGAGPESPSVA